MTWTYSVTFEFDAAPPETVKGEIVAGKAENALHRAAKAAKNERPNTRFRSLVVLLEPKCRERSAEERADDEYFRSGTRYPGQ